MHDKMPGPETDAEMASSTLSLPSFDGSDDVQVGDLLHLRVVSKGDDGSVEVEFEGKMAEKEPGLMDDFEQSMGSGGSQMVEEDLA